MATNMECLVSFEGVTKSYEDVVALCDVDFAMESGETVALCGPNGSGKSTFLQLAIGLVRPSLGAVTVMGEDPNRNWQIKREIGYMGDVRNLIGELTIEELLWYVGRVRGLSKPMGPEIQWLIEGFQLAPKRHEWLCNLSNGMRSKLALLQALVGAPPFLILDEPTSGFDIEAQQFCKRLLAKRIRQGTTILMGTHDFRLLDAIQPRILLLDKGRIVAEGQLGDLLATHHCHNAEDLILKLWPTIISRT